MQVTDPTSLPVVGNVVRVRNRNWLVSHVARRDGEQTRVEMACIDSDAAGQPLEVFWELEIGSRVIPDEPKLLSGISSLDEPALFGAYLNALRWDCVTSTNPNLLQAPFRAGVNLLPYQLEPLR
ncbi:MAG: hypothetical protein KC561_01950, partial [Myxococcales bacterium]|nr:hypothetical protein [Myxococcales bacterium]